MDYILVRRPLILTLQSLLLVLAIIIGASADSNPPCEPKYVILDASGNYTIFHEVCMSAKCQPTNDDCNCAGVVPDVGRITTNPTLIGDLCKGTTEIQDPEKHFSVSLHREDFTDKSIYNCTITYQYASECYDDQNPVNGPHVCPCHGKVNLDLVVIVPDLELSVDTGDGTLIGPKEENREILVDLDKTTATSNKNISLKCTTNVTGLLDFTMHFELDTSNSTIILRCPKDSAPAVVDGNFIISRQENDCILTIMNASQEDSGNYSCNIRLPHSNTRYNNDSSNIVSLVSNIKLEKSSAIDNRALEHIFTALFVIVVILIAVTLIALLVVNPIGIAICRKAKPPEQDVPAPRRRNRGLGRADITAVENGGNYGTICNSNLTSHSATPNPYATDTELPVSEGEGDNKAKQDHREVETPLDERNYPHGRKQLTAIHDRKSRNGRKARTGSKPGDSPDTDIEHFMSDTNLLLPARGQAPHNRKSRNTTKARTRSKSGDCADTDVEHFLSDTDLLLPAPHDHKSRNRTKARTESKSGDSSPENEHFLSDTDLLLLARAGRTPPSSEPYKYQCPMCGKRYAKDRRTFWKGHIRGKKCQLDTKTDELSSIESRRETGSSNSSPSPIQFAMDKSENLP